MISALTLLLAFQLAGEVIARGLGLQVPGPVIGMALLFGALLLRGGPGEDLRQTADKLLQHLSLLFIPAGTGIVMYGELIAAEWVPLTAALLGSTFLAIGVTMLVLKALSKRPKTGQSTQP
ncbi:MAG TPA: CidA/LrgA family protein [Thauera sp.]|jgi:holin-like protein|nr:CidA/LrgA family protein [Thauera sp.]